MQPVQLCLRCSHSNLLHRGLEDNNYPCISGGCSCTNFRITSVKEHKISKKVGKYTIRDKVKE